MTSVDRSGPRGANHPHDGGSRRQPDDALRPSRDSADGEYNLAARVHGNRHHDRNGSGTASGRYNLVARVYGDGQANGRPESDGAGGAEAERFNLAARVYGNGSGSANGRANGNGAAAAVGLLDREDAPRGAAAPAEAGSPPRKRGRFTLSTFDSVRQVPAFRWYMLASAGSFGSMNMQQLVRGFLAFQLTGSFAALGTVLLASAIPGLTLTVFGGVVADRYVKKYVVQVGQTLSALLALAVGLLLLFDMLRFEHLVATAFVNGTIFAFMMPSRQSWIPDIVGMRRLMNAVALNSVMMTSTRMVGPLIGALMLAEMGAEYVYFTMMGLYAFSVTMLSRVPSRPIPERDSAAAGAPMSGAGRGRGWQRGGGGLGDLMLGFRYIAAHPVIRVLLVVNLVTMMLAMPYMMILPGWVLDVLRGDARQLGALQSIGAIGALGGALVVASLPNRRRGRYYLLSASLMGVMLLGFSQSTTFWPAAGFMVLLNIGSTMRQSLSSVLVQTYVADEYRGRVMSVYMMERSAMSLGAFGVGIAAELLGAQTAVMSLALGLAGFSVLVFAFVPRLRNLD